MSGLINKISKTRFIKGINCPRFFPLFEIYKNKEQATVSFKDDLSDLMTEENSLKISDYLSDMYEEQNPDDDLEEVDDDELPKVLIDKINKPDPKLEVMMPYFKQMEALSASYAEYMFKTKVIFDFETYKQKRFEAKIQDYDFYSFLDAYQETDNLARVIETKATTSKKFVNVTYTSEDKEKLNFFVESPDGILMTREALKLDVDEKYFKKKADILKRMHAVGSYIYDLTYQRYVIEKSNTLDKQVKYLLAVLNHEYVFDGVYKNGKPDYLKDMDKDKYLIKFIDVTDLTKDFLASFEADVDIVIDRLDHMTYDASNPGPLCPRNGKHKCMFHDICYKNIPKYNSIFTYIGSHNGFKDEHKITHTRQEMIDMGMINMLDVPYSWLNRTSNVLQYDVVHDNKVYMDKERIKLIIDQFKYPLYHLDFETFASPLPRFKGEVPYVQSVFQFNLHIEHKPGVSDEDKDSYVYLATDALDHREQLTKYLCELIKDDGLVIAWNDKFEKGRMKELASYFPQYSDKLNEIINKTFDLWYVFNGFRHVLYDRWNIPEKKGFNYYHKDLNGSFSIKKVLPIFVPKLSYDNLEVKNGNEALVVYANFPTMNKKDFEVQKNALIAYCKQDTWAMVLLLDALRKSI